MNYIKITEQDSSTSALLTFRARLYFVLWAVYYGKFSNMPGLYPLHARSTPLPTLWRSKPSPAIVRRPLGVGGSKAKPPQLRYTVKEKDRPGSVTCGLSGQWKRPGPPLLLSSASTHRPCDYFPDAQSLPQHRAFSLADPSTKNSFSS